MAAGTDLSTPGAAGLPDRYAVIGHPVSHSRSPFIHASFARQVRHHLVYGTIDAMPTRLAASVREFLDARRSAGEGPGRGLNVTLPHKQAATALCDVLTPRAARAAAVNTLVLQADGRLAGDNTDGAGLVRDLTVNQRVGIASRRVLLIGAGGAVRGALAPLLGLAPRELVIANRAGDRARALGDEFADLGPVSGVGLDELDGEPFDVLINATSAGLAGDAPALPASAVSAQSFCYDMLYGGDDTPFLRWAHEHGCVRTAMGFGMLVEQAAEAFLIWRGVRPDTAAVLAELRASR